MFEIASISMAALAALLSYFAAREARVSSSKSAEASLEIAKAQHDLYVRELRLQYFSELRRWADESIDVLGELMGLCHINPELASSNYREMQVTALNGLSSLIDRGRLFLPNYARDQHGLHKEEAYKGYRHPALDQLVMAFGEGKKISYTDMATHRTCYKEIETRKRKFISIIQKLIETDEWQRLMKERRIELDDSQ